MNKLIVERGVTLEGLEIDELSRSDSRGKEATAKGLLESYSLTLTPGLYFFAGVWEQGSLTGITECRE